jgi:hypothetical protein
LVSCLGFPSWLSIKDWRTKEKHKLCLCDNAFSPCKDNVIRNVRRFIFDLRAELPIQNQSSPLHPFIKNLPEITTDTNPVG